MSYYHNDDSEIIAAMQEEIEELKRKIRDLEDACDTKDDELRRLHRVCQESQGGN